MKYEMVLSMDKIKHLFWKEKLNTRSGTKCYGTVKNKQSNGVGRNITINWLK